MADGIRSFGGRPPREIPAPNVFGRQVERTTRPRAHRGLLRMLLGQPAAPWNFCQGSSVGQSVCPVSTGPINRPACLVKGRWFESSPWRHSQIRRSSPCAILAQLAAAAPPRPIRPIYNSHPVRPRAEAVALFELQPHRLFEHPRNGQCREGRAPALKLRMSYRPTAPQAISSLTLIPRRGEVSPDAPTPIGESASGLAKASRKQPPSFPRIGAESVLLRRPILGACSTWNILRHLQDRSQKRTVLHVPDQISPHSRLLAQMDAS